MEPVRPLVVFGTRPEVIKLAPVIHESVRRCPRIQPIVCQTGQHREMVSDLVEYFGLQVQENLQLMRPNQDLAELTAACLTGISDLIARLRPDCVIAQGDTTTVLAAALGAFYRSTPFVHVEAGLRTGDLAAPWPEEMNRRVASLVGTVHCAPTRRAADNLRSEHVPAALIHITGNTVIDAMSWTLARERQNSWYWESKYSQFKDSRVVLITGHRRENFGYALRQICRAILELSEQFADVEFVYPVHLNPNVRQPVRDALAGRNNVQLVEPVGYPEFVWLMDRATIILTDSGGVQEEAPSLKKPVLVMRDATERPEGVEAGAVELVGTCHDRIVERVRLLLTDREEYQKRQIAENPYGDGKAAMRIVDLLERRAWQMTNMYTTSPAMP